MHQVAQEERGAEEKDGRDRAGDPTSKSPAGRQEPTKELERSPPAGWEPQKEEYLPWKLKRK